MTRKFVYDPHVERVRLVAWSTGSHAALIARRLPALRWVLLTLALAASALAFDAAHASAPSDDASSVTRGR